MDFPGEKLVIKMWETLAEKPICALLKPYQMLREGKASIQIKREEVLMLAQAEKDAERIRSGELSHYSDPKITNASSKKTNNVTPVIDMSLLYSYAKDEVVAKKINEDINVAKAILKAEEVLSNETADVPKDNIDYDWLYRWSEKASKVSSDTLQTLWGRVLAGEVKAPGSYSLRTIEFLHSLSQSEARLIEKMMSLVINGKYIFRNDLNKEYDSLDHLDFNEVLELSELGLIYGAEAGGLSFSQDIDVSNTHTLVFRNKRKALTVLNEKMTGRISLSVFQLTKLGDELIGLAGGQDDEAAFYNLAQEIKKQGFSVRVWDINSMVGDHVNLVNGNEI